MAWTTDRIGTWEDCHVGESQTVGDGVGPVSVQERLYPALRCFGCGQANPKGLRLRSYPTDGAVVASFTPWPEHDNGLGYLNGGIIATVLDCHSAAVVMLEAERHQWMARPGAALPYVTAGLDLRYLRPSPLQATIELRGVVASADEAEIVADVELLWEGKTRAAATARWRRWSPR
jgi:acyl-coenzyme A thioesterase PaaI-like protein